MIKTEDLMTALRLAVEVQGHSLRDAAQRLGVTHRTVRKWVLGQTEPYPRNRMSIYRYCLTAAKGWKALWAQHSPIDAQILADLLGDQHENDI